MTQGESVTQPEDPYKRKPLYFGPRMVWFSLLFIGLSALGIYVVYSRVAGRSFEWDDRLWSAPVVLGSLMLLLLYYISDGLRLWFTLRTLDQKIELPAIAKLVFLNIFVSNVTPFATGGGFAQVWFLQRRGVPIGTAMTATTIRTVLAVLFIFGATPALLLTLPSAEQATRGNSLMATLVVCVILYLGFFLILLTRPGWLIRPASRLVYLAHWLHLISEERYQRWHAAVKTELQRFSAGFRHYFQGFWLYIAGSLFFTALFLLTLFSFPAVLLWGLGYDLDYWIIVGRLVITTFVMYFSPTPGASGIAEGVFGSMFSGLLTAGHLVMVTVVWRALTIYLGMAIGVFVTHHELRREPFREALS